MKNLKNHFFTLFILLWALSLGAYGALFRATSGAPYSQPISTNAPLIWSPETGPIQSDESLHSFSSDAQRLAFCGEGASGGGCALTPQEREAKKNDASNAAGIALIQQSWIPWQAVASTDNLANIAVSEGSSLGIDVDICNFTDVLIATDEESVSSDDPRICGCLGTCSLTCATPIVFDGNGDIIAFEYGEGNRGAILAVTSPLILSGVNHIVRAQVIFNGICYEDNPNTSVCGSFVFTSAKLNSVMVHEFGHVLGLTHAQVNGDLVTISSTGAASVSPANAEAVPTLYPLLVENADQTTLHPDDKRGLAHLYPTSSFTSNFCTAEGQILNGSGQGVRCAEVVLRPATSPIFQAISFITGSEVTNNGETTQAGCTASPQANCGNFTIEGLVVGATYTIEVNKINSLFTGGSSISPCDPPNQSFNTLLATGSITCPAGGVTITCDTGDVTDPDLCPSLP